MADPVKGDWVNHLKDDFAFIEKDVNEEEARSNSKIEYKKVIKTLVKEKVFEKLKNIQDTHSKVKEIIYNTFKIQEYMISSSLTNSEVSFLFSLRSRTVKSVKNNFGRNDNCSLGCFSPENQEHWLDCDQTRSNQNTPVKYSDIYGTLTQQTNIVKLFIQLEEERKELSGRAAPGLPVADDTGPRPTPGQ